MSTKISSLLDAVANRLEARGLLKEALEIDKVADVIEKRAASQTVPGKHRELIARGLNEQAIKDLAAIEIFVKSVAEHRFDARRIVSQLSGADKIRQLFDMALDVEKRFDSLLAALSAPAEDKQPALPPT